MSLAQLTLWQEASPASHSVLRESDAARQMAVISGQKLFALFKRPSPVGSLLKMLLSSSQWYSTLYRLTWKAQGTKQGRCYFQLVPQARHISAHDALSWPTPVAQEDRAANYTLKRMWATPTATDEWAERFTQEAQQKSRGDGPCESLALPDSPRWAMAQSRLGGDVDGFASWLDGSHFPAFRGQDQYAWEPPRTLTEKGTHHSERLKALGNGVVWQQFYPIFKAIMDFEEAR